METGKDTQMNIRWIGAILVVIGCTGVGCGMALYYKRQLASLRQLLKAMDFMRCELMYRMTPLPELCGKVSAFATGSIRNVFCKLKEELESQISPDASGCMTSALAQSKDLPGKTLEILSDLGKSLGEFDLDGQVSGIDSAILACKKELEEMESDRVQRLRSYQTLGLCAGAALAILLI